MGEKYKIIHDREICIGCSACASVCPKFWEMSDDGKSNLIGAKKTGEEEALENLTENYDSNLEAAESCPVNCIHLFKDDEKVI